MIILLPHKGHFEAFEEELTAGQLEEIIAGLEGADLSLTMPPFNFAAEFGLADMLAGMGMPDAFDDDVSDFSGMYDRLRAGPNLYLSDVIHKTYVTADQFGTEAAAATGATMWLVSDPRAQIEINRPFLFFIRHLESGTILFAGRVVNP